MKVGYSKALRQIEKFMKDSGIRDICSNYCLGTCCSGCYTSTAACHKNEGRRLLCSFYVCHQLKVLLFSKQDYKIYDRIDRCIEKKLREIMDRNPYFVVNNEATRNAFFAKNEILSTLNKIDVNKVQERASAFRSLYRKINERERR